MTLATNEPGDGSRPWTAAVWFIATVLTLASLQALPNALDSTAVAVPGWLRPVTTVLGGGLSPTWAVVLVGGLTIGWPSLARLVRGSVRVSVGVGTYLLAALAPIAVMTVAVVVSGVTPEGITISPTLLVGQVLLVAPIFAFAEQLGWRVWLQRSLQTRLSPVLAGGLVGCVWSAFHWPLFLSGSPTVHAQLPYLPFFAVTTILSILLAELYNASRGSLLPVVTAHVVWNVSLQFALPTTREGTVQLLFVAAGTLVVLVLVLRWWWGARQSGLATPIQ